jgi:hypothetical protein
MERDRMSILLQALPYVLILKKPTYFWRRKNHLFWQGSISCRGWCYDHNFLRFSTIFGERIGIFLINQCHDPIFAWFSFVLSKKRQVFRQIFKRKYFLNHNVGPGFETKKVGAFISSFSAETLLGWPPWSDLDCATNYFREVEHEDAEANKLCSNKLCYNVCTLETNFVRPSFVITYTWNKSLFEQTLL